MDLTELLIFHHVAGAGGFEAARRRLGGLEISGIRRRVRQLEQELGMPLYRRRPFQLTPVGRMLYEHDRPLLEKLLGVAAHLKRKSLPRLRAGVTGSATKLFLVEPVRAWLNDPRRIPIDCRLGSFRELHPALEMGELDLLITARDGPAPAGYSAHLLATFPQVLIVPERSPLKDASELWTSGCLDAPLITPEEEDPVTRAFERGLRLGGLVWPASLTCDSPATMANLVALGLGYGLTLAAAPCGDRRPDGGRPTTDARGRKADSKKSETPNHRQPTADSSAATRCPPPSDPPSPISHLPSPIASASGIRELPLVGFDPVSIVALWRPDDARRLEEPLRLLRGQTSENR